MNLAHSLRMRTALRLAADELERLTLIGEDAASGWHELMRVAGTAARGFALYLVMNEIEVSAEVSGAVRRCDTREGVTLADITTLTETIKRHLAPQKNPQ